MSTMSDSSAEGVPWLDKEDERGTTVTATVIEGAEVVRTAAVSYATPILHQVFIQGTSNPRENTSVTVSTSPSDLKSFRFSIAPATSPRQNGLLPKSDGNNKLVRENSSVPLSSFLVSSCSSSQTLSSSSFSSPSSSSSSSSSSSVPLWVFSSSLLPSSSVVLRPVTHPTPASKHSPNAEVASISASSSPLGLSILSSSSSSSPILSPFSSTSGTKNDDELTSLSWLQDSNLLMGTALSPIKHQPSSKSSETTTTTTTTAGDRKRSHRATNGRKDTSSSNSNNGKPEEGKDSTKRASSESIKLEAEEEFKVESPTSDYGEEANEISGEGAEVGETTNPKTSTSSVKSQPIPYNPKIHVKAKPPFSFSCLIFMAIEESPTKALPVKDIYSWILEHYPYYRNAPTGWKNSVRHNLSLNKCFSKVEKAPNLGKGSLWMVDPTFRPNLLQAMSKTPFTPQSSLDKNCVVNKAVINTKYLYGLTSKTPDKVITMGDFVVQNEVEVLPSNTTLSGHDRQTESEELITKECQIPSTKSYQISTKYSSEFNEETDSKRFDGDSKIKHRNSSTLYTPNPELFPRLAKRLESHSVETGTHFHSSAIDVHREDVDAAAAMLVLKHGRRVLSPYRESFPNLKGSPDTTQETVQSNFIFKRNHKSSESSDSGSMVISSSPSLDHAYVSWANRKGSQHNSRNNYNIDNHLTPHTDHNRSGKSKETTSPTSSVDEAFFDDSFESETVGDTPVTSSVETHPFEEADALLNLAAVATSLASRQEMTEEGNSNSSYNCTESQPSYSETQLKTQPRINNTNKPQPPKASNNKSQLQSKESTTNNQKQTKRKFNSSAKFTSSKKPANLYATSNLAIKTPPKSSPSLKVSHNNNSNAVLNRNKLLKVKKVLKVHKPKC